MISYIVQVRKNSSSSLTISRTQRLRRFEDVFKDFMLTFFSNPENQRRSDITAQLSLSCVRQGLWGQIINLYSSPYKAKQNFGLIIPIFLNELFGADSVETLRFDNNLKNCTVRAPENVMSATGITCFTPHRVLF